MPSFRIVGSSVSLSMFDVVGKDGDQPRFIDHVGLAEAYITFQPDAVVILDMGPPLHGPGGAKSIRASAVGSAELNDDEEQKIRTFLDLHAGEHASLLQLNQRQIVQRAPEMYCIYPHAVPHCEVDGRYVRTRFSCAGFVLEAYEFARITLLESDELPMVGRDVLKAGYPVQMQLLASGRLSAESLGLTGAGPWRVLLCGYLFNSLARSADEIREQPYLPMIEDRFFTR